MTQSLSFCSPPSRGLSRIFARLAVSCGRKKPVTRPRAGMGYNAGMNAKPRRRWLQFRLRTLLGLTLFACLPVGVVEIELRRCREQRDVVEAIEKFGAVILYDYERGNPFQPPAVKERLQTWLRNLFGKDFMVYVAAVNFQRTPIADADLLLLHKLTKLDTLWLSETQITDAGLEHLGGLKQLRFLYLGSQVTDACLPYLRALTQLEYLHLRGTQVTESGRQELQKMLPNANIFR